MYTGRIVGAAVLLIALGAVVALSGRSSDASAAETAPDTTIAAEARSQADTASTEATTTEIDDAQECTGSVDETGITLAWTALEDDSIYEIHENATWRAAVGSLGWTTRLGDFMNEWTVRTVVDGETVVTPCAFE